MPIVAQISTLHDRRDVRIYLKEAQAISEIPGLQSYCIFDSDDRSQDPVDSKVKTIIAGSRILSSIRRLTTGHWRMFKTVFRLKPDVVQFHDPELILLGLILKSIGYKVIYDVHENTAAQLMGNIKHTLFVRRLLGQIIKLFEKFGAFTFDGVICATPAIASQFRAKRLITIQNFPMIGELVFNDLRKFENTAVNFVYVGGINEIRGSAEMLEAIHQLEEPTVSLTICGLFPTNAQLEKSQQSQGWKKVVYLGWCSRKVIAENLANSLAGLVLFHPLPNHINAQPNKLFEYMSAGLPVIASDFPLWRKIIEGANCGLLVDPLSPSEIAAAMKWVIANPIEAREMGKRGQTAVKEHYNWELEATKLKDFYIKQLMLN